MKIANRATNGSPNTTALLQDPVTHRRQAGRNADEKYQSNRRNHHRLLHIRWRLKASTGLLKLHLSAFREASIVRCQADGM